MARDPARPKLKKNELLRVTKIPSAAFEHWFDRRLIKLSGDDEPSDGKGKPRLHGKRTTIKLAIAHRISMLGIPANIAVTLATKFTDEPQIGREIGEPFAIGRTVLVAAHTGASRVVNVEPDSDLDSVINTNAAIVIDVGAIVSEINSRIGQII